MKRIISVSRRTDIPAFYSDWFMARLAEGFAGVVHPFGGQRYIVSLKPEDVVCFVFWSKNFTPFLEHLNTIENMGYKFYFNYTITGLPSAFESNVQKETAIESLKQLSKTYSPKHINWRFDPIIISSICDRDFHIRAFEKLASELAGYVERCYFSFVARYGKVIRNFTEFEKSHNLKIFDCSNDFRIDLASELTTIAENYGIEMFSCCGDYLVGEKIQKAHCIDGRIIEELFFPEGFSFKHKPTRDECGCTESTDIGTYDTCPHGCIYCYANTNKGRANKAFQNHDKTAAFLCYTKAQSDKWLKEIQNSKTHVDYEQPRMF
jgi:hypothetical protein